MQAKFLGLIALVFLLSIGFVGVIWRQTVRFEQKARAARERLEEQKDALKQQIMAEKLAARAAREAEAEAKARAAAQAAADFITRPPTSY